MGLFALCAFLPFLPMADEVEATPTNIDIAKGMRYTYTPTWPSDLTVTTTIKSQSITDSDAWGTISNNTLTVRVPKTTDLTTYDVVLIGKSSNPYQEHEIPIRFNIQPNLAITGTQANVVQGQAINFQPSKSDGMGNITQWYVTTGETLPTGLSINQSTGKVTGSISTPGNYSIKITGKSNYGETANLVTDFQVYSTLSVTNSPTNGTIIYEV